MTLRADAKGVFRADSRPTDDVRPAPFTTIATVPNSASFATSAFTASSRSKG